MAGRIVGIDMNKEIASLSPYVACNECNVYVASLVEVLLVFMRKTRN